MPQVDIDGANSKLSADTIRGQSERKKNLGQGDDGLWPTSPKE